MNNFEILPSTEVIPTNNANALVAMQEKISALKVSSITTIVQQSPTSENGNTAICQTELIVDGKRTSMCGIATPDTSQSDKAHILLADAFCSSMASAVRAMQGCARSTSPFAESPFSTDDNNFEPSSESKFKGKHNPKKPISEKQTELILSLAQKQNQPANSVALGICGKQIKECSSADANEIIRHLQGKA